MNRRGFLKWIGVSPAIPAAIVALPAAAPAIAAPAAAVSAGVVAPVAAAAVVAAYGWECTVSCCTGVLTSSSATYLSQGRAPDHFEFEDE